MVLYYKGYINLFNKMTLGIVGLTTSLIITPFIFNKKKETNIPKIKKKIFLNKNRYNNLNIFFQTVNHNSQISVNPKFSFFNSENQNLQYKNEKNKRLRLKGQNQQELQSTQDSQAQQIQLQNWMNNLKLEGIQSNTGTNFNVPLKSQKYDFEHLAEQEIIENQNNNQNNSFQKINKNQYNKIEFNSSNQTQESKSANYQQQLQLQQQEEKQKREEAERIQLQQKAKEDTKTERLKKELQQQKELEDKKLAEEAVRTQKQELQLQQKVKEDAEEERLKKEQQQQKELEDKKLAEEAARIQKQELQLQQKVKEDTEEERLRKELQQQELEDKKLAEEAVRTQKQELQLQQKVKEDAEETERLKKEQQQQKELEDKKLAEEAARIQKQELQLQQKVKEDTEEERLRKELQQQELEDKKLAEEAVRTQREQEEVEQLTEEDAEELRLKKEEVVEINKNRQIVLWAINILEYAFKFKYHEFNIEILSKNLLKIFDNYGINENFLKYVIYIKDLNNNLKINMVAWNFFVYKCTDINDIQNLINFYNSCKEQPLNIDSEEENKIICEIDKKIQLLEKQTASISNNDIKLKLQKELQNQLKNLEEQSKQELQNQLQDLKNGSEKYKKEIEIEIIIENLDKLLEEGTTLKTKRNNPNEINENDSEKYEKEKETIIENPNELLEEEKNERSLDKNEKINPEIKRLLDELMKINMENHWYFIYVISSLKLELKKIKIIIFNYFFTESMFQLFENSSKEYEFLKNPEYSKAQEYYDKLIIKDSSELQNLSQNLSRGLLGLEGIIQYKQGKELLFSQINDLELKLKSLAPLTTENLQQQFILNLQTQLQDLQLQLKQRQQLEKQQQQRFEQLQQQQLAQQQQLEKQQFEQSMLQLQLEYSEWKSQNSQEQLQCLELQSQNLQQQLNYFEQKISESNKEGENDLKLQLVQLDSQKKEVEEQLQQQFILNLQLQLEYLQLQLKQRQQSEKQQQQRFEQLQQQQLAQQQQLEKQQFEQSMLQLQLEYSEWKSQNSQEQLQCLELQSQNLQQQLNYFKQKISESNKEGKNDLELQLVQLDSQKKEVEEQLQQQFILNLQLQLQYLQLQLKQQQQLAQQQQQRFEQLKQQQLEKQQFEQSMLQLQLEYSGCKSQYLQQQSQYFELQLQNLQQQLKYFEQKILEPNEKPNEKVKNDLKSQLVQLDSQKKEVEEQLQQQLEQVKLYLEKINENRKRILYVINNLENVFIFNYSENDIKILVKSLLEIFDSYGIDKEFLKYEIYKNHENNPKNINIIALVFFINNNTDISSAKEIYNKDEVIPFTDVYFQDKISEQENIEQQAQSLIEKTAQIPNNNIHQQELKQQLQEQLQQQRYLQIQSQKQLQQQRWRQQLLQQDLLDHLQKNQKQEHQEHQEVQQKKLEQQLEQQLKQQLEQKLQYLQQQLQNSEQTLQGLEKESLKFNEKEKEIKESIINLDNLLKDNLLKNEISNDIAIKEAFKKLVEIYKKEKNEKVCFKYVMSELNLEEFKKINIIILNFIINRKPEFSEIEFPEIESSEIEPSEIKKLYNSNEGVYKFSEEENSRIKGYESEKISKINNINFLKSELDSLEKEIEARERFNKQQELKLKVMNTLNNFQEKAINLREEIRNLEGELKEIEEVKKNVELKFYEILKLDLTQEIINNSILEIIEYINKNYILNDELFIFFLKKFELISNDLFDDSIALEENLLFPLKRLEEIKKERYELIMNAMKEKATKEKELILEKRNEKVKKIKFLILDKINKFNSILDIKEKNKQLKENFENLKNKTQTEEIFERLCVINRDLDFFIDKIFKFKDKIFENLAKLKEKLIKMDNNLLHSGNLDSIINNINNIFKKFDVNDLYNFLICMANIVLNNNKSQYKKNSLTNQFKKNITKNKDSIPYLEKLAGEYFEKLVKLEESSDLKIEKIEIPDNLYNFLMKICEEGIYNDIEKSIAKIKSKDNISNHELNSFLNFIATNVLDNKKENEEDLLIKKFQKSIENNSLNPIIINKYFKELENRNLEVYQIKIEIPENLKIFLTKIFNNNINNNGNNPVKILIENSKGIKNINFKYYLDGIIQIILNNNEQENKEGSLTKNFQENIKNQSNYIILNELMDKYFNELKNKELKVYEIEIPDNVQKIIINFDSTNSVNNYYILNSISKEQNILMNSINSFNMEILGFFLFDVIGVILEKNEEENKEGSLTKIFKDEICLEKIPYIELKILANKFFKELSKKPQTQPTS